MLELAADEQKAFIETYKEKVLTGKTRVEKPKFTCLLGAKGSGKTTLGRKLENTVLVSTDDIIADYFKTMGYDPREYQYDNEERKFFSKVANDVFMGAIHKGYHVAFDTGLTDNTEKMIAIMESKGYQTEIKAILSDDILVQLNVAERKLNFDNNFALYKEGQAPYPDGQNPTQVDLNLASKSAMDVVDFLQDLYKSGGDFEVYEYAKEEPAYDTRQSKQSFEDYLYGYCNRLPNETSYKERISRLQKEADKQGNEGIAMSLCALKNKIFGKGSK